MSKTEKIKVALADDHTMFRRGLISILKPYRNIEVLFDAANGQELVEQIHLAEEKPAICIIDINMPEMNGYDTARYIKKHFPKIKMLALSMYDDEDNIIKMLRYGANGYLLKDSEPDTLVEALKQINEQGFYQTERSYGSFYRAIPLPEGIDGEQAKANFNNGVLEITMPMPERRSRGRRIEIGEGGTQAKGKSAG